MAQQNKAKNTSWRQWLTSGAGLLLLILAYSIFLRCHGLFDPWDDDVPGYAGGYNCLSARNYVRYGLWHLKLAQYWEGGPINSSSYVYANHPPLAPLLVSFSFRLFRTTSEWSARLVPIIFSIAGIFVLYRLVKKVWTTRVALLACFMAAVMPMAAYYAGMVCYETLDIFSFLLVLYFYLAYLERPGARNLTYMLLSLLFGALNDWPIFYAVPLLCAHYLFWAKTRKKSFLLFPLFAGLTFALVATLVTGRGSLYNIYHIFYSFYSYLTEPELYGEWSRSVTMATWLRTVLSYHVRLYTLPILLLALGWLAGFVICIARRENPAKDALTLILLLFGLMHVGLGWQRTADSSHAFWAALSIPGLALTSAIVLDKTYDRLVAWSGKSIYVTSLFCVLLLVFAAYCAQRLYSLYSPSDSYYQLGTLINRTSRYEDVVIIPYGSGSPVAQFYADRNLRDDVADLSDFSKAYYEDPRAARTRYFLMHPTDHLLYPELYQFLDTAFDHGTDQEIVIFDLQRKKISDAEITSYLDASKGRYNFWAVTRATEDTPPAIPGNFQQTLFTINGETRRVLALAPNSRVTFPSIRIAEGARLKFGIGIDESRQMQEGSATQFEVIVRSGDDDHVLFSKRLDPQNDETARAWQDELLDLSPFSGQDVSITLALTGGPGPAPDAAGWSDLEIISDSYPQSKRP